MNHTYRLVWNRTLSMFVAVSECARTMGKAGGAKAGAVAALVLAAAAAPALADQAGSIDAGQTVAASTLPAGTIAFQGGTLQLDAPGLLLDQNFTIDGHTALIDQNGVSALASGVLADVDYSVHGALSVVNSGSGGVLTLTGINT